MDLIKQMEIYTTPMATKFLVSFISIVLLIIGLYSCQNKLRGETLNLVNKISRLDSKNDTIICVIKSKHLKILNGGYEPKYFLKFGAEIHSIEGEDIVFIEMSQTDTLVQQFFLPRKLKKKIHISKLDYFSGDTLKMDMVSGNISIWK